MPRTPITAGTLEWRQSCGHDDLLLVEGRADLATAVRVVERRAGSARAEESGTAPLDIRTLPVGDIDALIVDLRRERLGDRLIAEGSCGQCGARVDVDFSLAAYLEHNRPRRTELAAPDEQRPGWWRLRRYDTAFRIPSAGDVLAAGSGPEGRAALLESCFSGDLGARAVRTAERALARIAPVLHTTVAGQCPDCGAEAQLEVDARGIALTELGFLAGSVLDEVHLIAAAYHWTEQAILDLPSTRRAAYAERVRITRAAVGALVQEAHLG